MAKRRASSSASRPARGKRAERAPKTKSKKPKAAKAAGGDVEVVEEGPGIGLDAAVVIATTIVLLVACLVLDYRLGTQYGAGLFFK